MANVNRENLKTQLLAHPIVMRLLNNPNWAPAARAAVDYFVDKKNCPVQSWRRSSTWQQVQMVFDEVAGEESQNS